MEPLTLLILSLYLALSIGMAMFSVTQLGYQNRPGILKQFYKVPYVFMKGLVAWPVLLPLGFSQNKYRCNVAHKIGRDVG